MKNTPKYLLIADQIKKQIINGDLKPGDQLPQELAMVKSYNVSRITIRNALKELENQDLIYRVQGAGTFVKENNPTPKKDPEGFELINLKKYHFKLIDFGVGAATEAIAKRLAIHPNDIVFHVKRLALSAKDIVAFQNVWLPAKVVNNLNMDALEKSIYPLVEEKISTKPKLATREFTVVKLSDAILREFKDKLVNAQEFDNDEELLRCVQVSTLKDDQPFETTETLYRINKYPIKEVVLA